MQQPPLPQEDLLSEEDLQTEEYPLLLDRVQSTFIDLVLLIVMMFIFAALLEKYENPPDWIRIALFFGLWALYEPLCTVLGCTLGQYLKNIRVRNYPGASKRINILQAIVRYALKTCLGWISFLTINSNHEKRAIHDYVSGSVMVRAK